MTRILAIALLASVGPALAEELPKLTSLSDAKVRYRVPEKAYVILKRAGVEAVIVDNRAVDDAVLPGHRAGYSGVASLRGAGRKDNLFVPGYAGLNFEHIHDGTVQKREVLFRAAQRADAAAGHRRATRPSCTRRPRRTTPWRAACATGCWTTGRSR